MTGWAMIFDYVLNPIICVIWCSKAALNFVPQIPPMVPGMSVLDKLSVHALHFLHNQSVWLVFFAFLFTALNLRGIKASARTNALIAGGLGVVILLFFAAAARYIYHASLPGNEYFRPFYDPNTFSFAAVSTGVSVAALTYIGFDGISTLSEEAINPRRNILLATVLTCLLTGVLASTQVYAGQLIWPDYKTFPDVDTAFVHIAGRAGGPMLFSLVNLALLVATIGSGAGSHLAAGRLLYGMGRDNAIPRGFFGVIDPRTRIPRNNILLVGAIALGGAFSMNYELGAELLNFGAFIGFMGVNLSALVRYYFREKQKSLSYLVPPVIGFLICLYIWLSLGTKAKIIGVVWLATGFLYGAWKTRWFRDTIHFAEPTDDQ
jgi:amino acid transporter